jgi:hypothetical protein
VASLPGTGHASQLSPPPPPPPPDAGARGFVDFNGPGTQADGPSARGTGLIFGRVVDASAGRPLGGVVVRLVGTPDPARSPGERPSPPASALTNAQGQFLFRDLPEGRYSISTQLGGYLPGAYGRTSPEGPPGQVRLGDGQRITDVTLRLWQYGAITGRLLDEAGEPAVGVSLRLLRRSIVAGRRQWQPGPTSQTDDRGVYRFGTLTPGEYVVAATAGLGTMPVATSDAYLQALQSGGGPTMLPPALQEASVSPAGAGTRLGDLHVQPLRNTLPPPPSPPDEVLTYQTVFHPSATTLAEAARVRVGPGEEKSGIDVQMRLVRTFRVSGQVLGPDGQPMSAGLLLLPAAAGELTRDYNFETATAVSGDDGRFVFLGVPPGDYFVRMMRVPRPAISPGVMTTITTSGGGMIGFSGGPEGVLPPPPDEPTLWAEAPVTVAGHVENVSVVVRSGARVHGKVVFEGPGERPEPQQRRAFSFSLVPASGQLGGLRQPAPGRLVDEETFLTSQYPPDRYFMNVTGSAGGWTIRSVDVAGRNALEEPFELGASDVTGVVVTFTTGRTVLSGTVHSGGGPAAHATILLFPSDYERWIANGMRATRTRSAATGADGSFEIAGMLPGDYLVVALPPEATADTDDPAVIAAIASSGTSVRMEAGQTRSVALTVSPMR